MRYFYCLVFFTLHLTLQAQHYDREIGVQGLLPNAISFRKYMDMENAREAILQFSDNGIRVFGLREHFKPAFFEHTDNIVFVYGYGLHTGIVKQKQYEILHYNYKLDKNTYSPVLGLAGIIGLEYHFWEFPVVAGIALKPYFEYSTYRFFNMTLGDVSIALKYRF